MVISSLWPDIRLFSVSGIRPDIRQLKSGIRSDTGYKKRPDYPVHPHFKVGTQAVFAGFPA
jgi:hypothetical protein